MHLFYSKSFLAWWWRRKKEKEKKEKKEEEEEEEEVSKTISVCAPNWKCTDKQWDGQNSSNSCN